MKVLYICFSHSTEITYHISLQNRKKSNTDYKKKFRRDSFFRNKFLWKSWEYKIQLGLVILSLFIFQRSKTIEVHSYWNHKPREKRETSNCLREGTDIHKGKEIDRKHDIWKSRMKHWCIIRSWLDKSITVSFIMQPLICNYPKNGNITLFT